MKWWAIAMVRPWLKKTPVTDRIKAANRSCHNPRKARSNCNARPTSTGPVLAGREDIHRLQGFERTARSPRLFRPAVPGSNSGGRARRQHFCQTVCAGDNSWVCASASSYRLPNAAASTRGMPSCCVVCKALPFVSGQVGGRTEGALSKRHHFVACIRIRNVYNRARAIIKNH